MSCISRFVMAPLRRYLSLTIFTMLSLSASLSSRYLPVLLSSNTIFFFRSAASASLDGVPSNMAPNLPAKSRATTWHLALNSAPTSTASSGFRFGRAGISSSSVFSGLGGGCQGARSGRDVEKATSSFAPQASHAHGGAPSSGAASNSFPASVSLGSRAPPSPAAVRGAAGGTRAVSPGTTMSFRLNSATAW